MSRLSFGGSGFAGTRIIHWPIGSTTYMCCSSVCPAAGVSQRAVRGGQGGGDHGFGSHPRGKASFPEDGQIAVEHHRVSFGATDVQSDPGRTHPFTAPATRPEVIRP